MDRHSSLVFLAAAVGREVSNVLDRRLLFDLDVVRVGFDGRLSPIEWTRQRVFGRGGSGRGGVRFGTDADKDESERERNEGDEERKDREAGADCGRAGERGQKNAEGNVAMTDIG